MSLKRSGRHANPCRSHFPAIHPILGSTSRGFHCFCSGRTVLLCDSALPRDGCCPAPCPRVRVTGQLLCRWGSTICLLRESETFTALLPVESPSARREQTLSRATERAARECKAQATHQSLPCPCNWSALNAPPIRSQKLEATGSLRGCVFQWCSRLRWRWRCRPAC